jgi:hypothetical protein
VTLSPRVWPGTSGGSACSSDCPQHRRTAIPAKSKAQQKAAGAALAAKRGDMKKSDLQGASKSMEKSMTEEELHDLAATKRKGKPDHASKS